MKNEYELHRAVVKYIQTHLPKFKVIVPGVGELQRDNRTKTRAKHMAYRPGQPDLILLTPNQYYYGMALEMKNPNKPFVLRDNQKQFLNDLVLHSCYKCIASNDYELPRRNFRRYNQLALYTLTFQTEYKVSYFLEL